MKTRILFNGVMGVGKSELANQLAAGYQLPLISGSKAYNDLSDNFREMLMAVDLVKKQDSRASYVSDRSVIDFIIGGALQNEVSVEELMEAVVRMYESGTTLFETEADTLTLLVVAPYINQHISIPPGHPKRTIMENLEERGATGSLFYMYSRELATLLQTLDPHITVVYNNFVFSGGKHEQVNAFRSRWQQHTLSEVTRLLAARGIHAIIAPTP